MIVKNVEKKEKSSVAFQVEIDSVAFEDAVNKAYLKNRKSISIPGFRRGKAPRQVIEGMYGKSVFYDDAIGELSPDAFEFGAESENLNTVGKPSIENVDISDDKILTISFQTAIYPEVTLGEYKNLEVEREKPIISETEVDAEIDRVRQRGARYEVVDRASRISDTVMIDFEGFIDSIPFEGGKAEGQGLTLGAGQFIPGFEDQLIGTKAGDDVTVNVTFPEDYQKEDLAGKAAIFKVKVNEVREEQLPALDDEFAKDVSEYDTLAEYREFIRAELLKNREQTLEEDFKRRILEKAISNMTAEVPEAMIEFRQDMVVNEYAQRLAMQGMSLEHYFNMTGMDPNALRQSARPIAIQQVQLDLLLNKVVEVENVEISEEEFAAELAEIAEIYGLAPEDAKAQIGDERIRSDAKLKKASELITNSGIAVAPAPTVLGKPVPEKGADAASEAASDEKAE